MTSNDSMKVSVVLRIAADDIDAHNAADRDVIFTSECFRDLADRIDSETVELPRDRDGVPIHVGDVMEERSGHTFEVASLMAFGGSDNWLVLSDARNFSSFRKPHALRHIQRDSWERIIQDAVKLGYADYPTTSYEAELVERCRRLAGEA